MMQLLLEHGAGVQVVSSPGATYTVPSFNRDLLRSHKIFPPELNRSRLQLVMPSLGLVALDMYRLGLVPDLARLAFNPSTTFPVVPYQGAQMQRPVLKWCGGCLKA